MFRFVATVVQSLNESLPKGMVAKANPDGVAVYRGSSFVGGTFNPRPSAVVGGEEKKEHAILLQSVNVHASRDIHKLRLFRFVAGYNTIPQNEAEVAQFLFAFSKQLLGDDTDPTRSQPISDVMAVMFKVRDALQALISADLRVSMCKDHQLCIYFNESESVRATPRSIEGDLVCVTFGVPRRILAQAVKLAGEESDSAMSPERCAQLMAACVALL